ncbi:LysE family translocator [Desulfovibrio sp. Huiquan2017]|uniref:LysE family translocator n=1 Tax=Desulfovibrio sp. Huiquan2017 TaxID=2816861 RepID=UPI0025708DA1|nr:LysE family translocator [Desulfovibrio sp. Huiquan2017]
MFISPGPVNMPIIASGTAYGFRRTFPFVSGATIGLIMLLLSLGLGLMQFVTAYPAFLKCLSLAGSLFILHVGYKIGSADPELSIKAAPCPDFKQGFLMQWFNPKAWLACIADISMFTAPGSHTPLFLFSGLYFTICYLSLAAWVVRGPRFGVVLDTRKKMQRFNILRGSLLCLCAVYLLLTSLLT